MAKKLIALLLAVMLVVSLTVPAYAVQTDKAPTAANTRTLTVGVINYVINDIGANGYQVHYWGGSATGDADLTATGKTEQKSVGSSYWGNAAQTFSMYTAEIPADATGFKVRNGNRWFGDDGATQNRAYIFNYSGDKALYETVEEPTAAPATEAETTSEETTAPVETITVKFTDAMNYGDVNVYYWPNGGEWPGKAMEKVEVNEFDQTVYTASIPADVEGVIFNGNGKQTVDITEGIADGAWWYTVEDTDDAGHNYVKLVGDEPATEAETTAPATEAETTAPVEAGYYLVGTMNNWEIADAYKLTKTEAEAEEYTITLSLSKDDQFKVATADGKWFPDGVDNNYVVTADGEYDVYFRPNYDGYDDWFSGCIYAAAKTIDEPTEAETTAPATEAETTAPATEAETTVPAETITVKFTDALYWGDVHVYYWDNGAEWPGTAVAGHRNG